MRDLKFRGMSVNGEWYYGNLALIKKQVNHIKPGSYISNSVGMPFAYQVRPETVGQFIGLLDKNKKEIYEGDIIEFDKFEWYRSPILSRAAIEKKPPYLEEVKWDFSLFDMRQNDYPAYCKIVGNIHENPELLEDK